MAQSVKRKWIPSDQFHLPRKDRSGCDYWAYIPDTLVGRRFVLDGEVAADVADAEAGVMRLNSSAVALASTEALARLLLRSEAVGSSHIEGLVVGGRRLLRYELASDLDLAEAHDVTAAEVMSNINAMDYAVNNLARSPVSVDGILEMHRLLLEHTDRSRFGGLLRTEQNWIGGSSYNPCSATFVPPPENEVPRLMEDLCEFVKGDLLSPVTQAAIAHAQFETIHPFVDGNGRAGRALVHAILRRRGLCENVLPPISLVLATRSRDYIAGLSGFRYDGLATGSDAMNGTGNWIATFAAATREASEQAIEFESRIAEIQQSWLSRLGPVRANSSVEVLINVLPGTPIFTVASAAQLLGRSFKAVNDAIERFVEAGIVSQVTVGRRNRAWEAPDVIAAFTDLERGLATPTGDTRTGQPVRDVPARRPK